MPSHTNPARRALRTGLLEQREQFMAGPLAAAAADSLLHHLQAVLAALEPQCLGLYWPRRSEFNAVNALSADKGMADLPANLPLALPFAEREPVRMHYRLWDGDQPTEVDGCGIPTSNGAEVVPDVVLIPCVGFTEENFRLGYGGGYFDRWLAQHPHVTAVGIAWSGSMIASSVFDAQPHDVELALIVTEHGVVS
jgi:5,10-methenyltetrahydrofolate synthetase